jgi:hypothetical protein
MAARFVANGLAAADDEDEFVAPPFPPRRSSVPARVSTATGFAPRRAQAVNAGFGPIQGSARDPWYYRVSWSLGLASMAIGVAILILGLGANRGLTEDDQGLRSVTSSSLAALIAGGGILLLVDVARNIRLLKSLADPDGGIQ